MESNPDYVTHDGPVLDTAVIDGLRELGGDEDPGLVLELIEMFLDDAPSRLSEMMKGLEVGDLELMTRSVHTLKSSAANMGAMLLSSICKEMEAAAREQDVARYAAMTEACRQAYDRSASALREVS